LRAGSVNEAVLRAVDDLAAAGTHVVHFRDMAELPHFNPDDDVDPLPGSVAKLRRAISEADAILICTPEYAGDLPGSFKNLLDWTVGGVETERKPVAWINASTSPTAAAGTHRALRTVLAYTGCEIIDDACVHVPVPRSAVDGGIVVDPALRTQIAAAVRTLTAAATDRQSHVQ
jgi:NAD(P)H-dependent FMN reductase